MLLVPFNFTLTAALLISSVLFPYATFQGVWGSIAESPATSNMSLRNQNSSRGTMTLDMTPDYITGSYFNPETGLEITIPENWNATQNKNGVLTQLVFQLKHTPQLVGSFMDSPPLMGLNIYPNNSSRDERFGFESLEFYSAYRSSETIPNDPSGCKRTSFEDIKIGGYPAIRVELECPFPFDPSLPIKTTFVIVQKDKSELSFYFNTPSAPNYEKYIPEFDKLVGSVNFNAPANVSSS